jgi:hypothetical protein
VAKLIYDKVYFKLKLVKTDKKGQFLLIQGITNQEEITIVIIHASNVGVPNFIEKKKNKTSVLKSTDRPQHNNDGRLQFTTFTNRKVIRTKNSTKEPQN